MQYFFWLWNLPMACNGLWDMFINFNDGCWSKDRPRRTKHSRATRRHHRSWWLRVLSEPNHQIRPNKNCHEKLTVWSVSVWSDVIWLKTQRIFPTGSFRSKRSSVLSCQQTLLDSIYRLIWKSNKFRPGFIEKQRASFIRLSCDCELSFWVFILLNRETKDLPNRIWTKINVWMTEPRPKLAVAVSCFRKYSSNIYRSNRKISEKRRF